MGDGKTGGFERGCAVFVVLAYIFLCGSVWREVQITMSLMITMLGWMSYEIECFLWLSYSD